MWQTMIRIVLLVGVLALLSVTHPMDVSAGVNVWTSLGPSGGDVTVLVVDPTTHSTVYAATHGGVYKSLDSGATWTLINSGLTINHLIDSVRSLAIDPLN